MWQLCFWLKDLSTQGMDKALGKDTNFVETKDTYPTMEEVTSTVQSLHVANNIVILIPRKQRQQPNKQP